MPRRRPLNKREYDVIKALAGSLTARDVEILSRNSISRKQVNLVWNGKYNNWRL